MGNILIIGASSGIGRETAFRLAGEGHRLGLLSRREPALREMVGLLPRAQGAHLALPADVGDSAAMGPAVEAAERFLGPLDALIYSAGAARITPMEETSDEAWQEMLSANLNGLFYAARAIVPRWRERGRGHLVAVLSVAARQAFAGWSAYTASKSGALGFLECLRAEVRSAGIHVTAVLPGATDTALWDSLGSDWDRSKMMPPEQVARVIAAILRETNGGMIEEIRVAPVKGNV